MSTPVIAATPRWLRAIPAALAFGGLLIPAATGVVNGQPRTAAGPNDALYQSGCGYFDQGNYSAAEDAFRRLAAIEPGNPRAIGGIVEVFLRQNRVDDAVNLAQSEVDKNPAQTQLRVILGNIYVRAGKDDQAIAEFQRAIDNGAKDQAGLYFRIGEAQHRKGDLDAAVASFDRAHVLAPANLPSLLQLALLLDGTGKPEQAIPLYEQILKLQPNHPIAMNNLAYLKAEDPASLDEALRLAQSAAQKLPDNPDAADTLGWVYLKKHQPVQAMAQFQKATSITPGRAAFHLHLAMALSQSGDRPGALKELNTALQDKPAKDEEQQIRALMAEVGQ